MPTWIHPRSPLVAILLWCATVAPARAQTVSDVQQSELLETMGRLAAPSPANVSEAVKKASDVAEAAQQAAEVHQVLMNGMNTLERYAFLSEWALPDGSSDVRSIDIRCDVAAPPREFAQVLGSRRRRDAFPIPQVAGHEGIFSTSWILVETARESGNARRLMDRLASREGQQADYVRMLALIVSQPGTNGEITHYLEHLASSLVAEGDRGGLTAAQVVTLASACQSNPLHQSYCQRLTQVAREAPAIEPQLRRHLNQLWLYGRDADAIASQRINDDWLAIGSRSSLMAHQDLVTHVPMGATTYLYRYPLGGDFRFQVDLISHQAGDRTSFGYNGHRYRVFRSRPGHVERFECLSQGGQNKFSMSGHRVGSHPQTRYSPWLTLTPHSVDDLPTRFRNLSLRGEPTILSDVPMIHAGMADWAALHSGGSTDGWHVVDEALHRDAHAPTEGQPDSTSASTILYRRPLLEDETVQYEFYVDEQCTIHPTLGRLAFLLRPDGVKLRWIVDETCQWTGLPIDNSIIEPLSRRGPRPLPFREKAWNRLSMSRSDQGVSIELNGTLIYARSMDIAADTRFGLHCTNSASDCLVRDAVLSGDWPAETNQAAFASPSAEGSTTNRAQWASLFPERDQADNVVEIMRRADGLPLEQRYQLLFNWVLPNAMHPTLRLNGHFIPLRSHAHQMDATPSDRLRSPLLSLLELAKQMNRLDEVERQMKQVDLVGISQQRAFESASALVAEAKGERAIALRHCENLYELNTKHPDASIESYWPEYFVARHFLHDANELVSDLLSVVAPERFDDEYVLRTELFRLRDQARIQTDRHIPREAEPIKPSQWLATSQYTASRHQDGRGAADWIAFPGFVHTRGGHASDLLIYESPLQGNYEVELEARQGDGRCDVVVGGQQIAINRNQIVVSDPVLGRTIARVPIAPPIQWSDGWSTQRFVVRDGTCTITADGRVMHSFPTTTDDDPWLAIRFQPGRFGGVRDLRITGRPKIQEKLSLNFRRGGAWRSYYTHDPDADNFRWQLNGAELMGTRDANFAGSGLERLLYYQRPLCDGDSIGYEFFYKPGEFEVHPALDGTAFLIDPDHVGKHHLTDGWFDRLFTDKRNVSVDDDSQAVPPKALLKSNEWNSMEVRLRGNVAQFVLNGRLAYEQAFSSSQPRLFGFFYFADDNAVHVRNTTLSGSWPRELPGLVDQELADPMVPVLDQSRDTLACHFEHDFANDGLAEQYFSIVGGQQGSLAVMPGRGVTVRFSDPSRWRQTGIRSKMRLAGDFDIAAEFSGLELRDGVMGSANLVVNFATEDRMSGRVAGSEQSDAKTYFAQIKRVRDDGAQLLDTEKTRMNADSATLRLARRGTQLHMLVKTESSPHYRRLKSFTVGDVIVRDVDLLAVGNRAAYAATTWKKMDIRAEQLSLMGTQGDRRIYIGNADGTELRLLTPEIPGRGNHGSPEFSPDGTKVAFDTWLGSSRTARIFTINVDGTGLTDLGEGTMPTYSPDGRKIYASTVGGMIEMDAEDGTNRTTISSTGWSINTNLQGDKAAFYDYSPSRNFFVVDLPTQQKTALLTAEHASLFSSYYWNPDWSPDGTKFAFTARGRASGERELVIVDSRGSQHGLEVRPLGQGLSTDVTWHPDGRRVIVHFNGSARLAPYFAITPDAPDSMEPFLPGLVQERVGGLEWSRDGSQFVIAKFKESVFDGDSK
ncbi:MAG: DUF1583 domain-containing protein [Planctomycetota bacterium]